MILHLPEQQRAVGRVALNKTPQTTQLRTRAAVRLSPSPGVLGTGEPEPTGAAPGAVVTGLGRAETGDSMAVLRASRPRLHGENDRSGSRQTVRARAYRLTRTAALPRSVHRGLVESERGERSAIRALE
jgi:hypothetical protein